MTKIYSKIAIILLACGLLGLFKKSSSREYVFSHSFQDWFLNLLQGEAAKSQTKPTVQLSLLKGNFNAISLQTCEPKFTEPNFLVFGGGGSPKSNEIALEKNILYFQRTLKQIGYTPSSASLFFANGNDGKSTIRYIDPQGKERFKVPNIPNLNGAATFDNLKSWADKIRGEKQQKPIFFYFTGHGILNPNDDNNNALMLWGDSPVTVRNLSNVFDKLPENSHIVTMMAQCFSGSFANLIYQGGDPSKAIALQTRCGFFATIKTLPSVGCTPEVNEADYQDYSSSFFAGLSGVNRLGKPVASADYNRDGRISYAEAHAFAKVDEKTPDLPVSTSEVWLQQKATKKDLNQLVTLPIVQLQKSARPEQKYVVDSLMKLIRFNSQKSYLENLDSLSSAQSETEEKKAYRIRLLMEILNIDMENKVRKSNQSSNIGILDKLIQCESSSWK